MMVARKKTKIEAIDLKVKITTRLDPATVKALKLAAVEAGESIETVISKAVAAYLRGRR